MGDLLALCGIALAAIVLTLTLKKESPAIAFLLALTAGLVILFRVFSGMGGAVREITQVFAQGGMSETLYLPVIKTVGVAVVVRVMGALSRDAGQSALAAKLEIAGSVLAIALCMPLLQQVLSLIEEWI
ncbi:stage III sporulation protein AD [Butyricicoccus faecihominis]|uniref:SpoIIIAC/SpoIIIAD family protein n=1 Tax=Butyricicoccaceae TaxID=3085642 RepID=UPI0024795052|nr:MULTISPECIES: SpoIIIAC/SpoIIIAD family protein [Butyricicoccaceae]MCQ5130197.1 stage III sporulation protein AD [Butyricicoccus faecihominis]WNX86644.1 SpoIIIAC/SpoIIIAD family protein [Agathobaculum sp. NTUH-O15-33]